MHDSKPQTRIAHTGSSSGSKHQHPSVNLAAALEAILFVGQEPLTVQRVVEALPAQSTAEVERAIHELGLKYRRQRRPYQIERTEVGYRLALIEPYQTDLRERMRQQRSVKLNRPLVEVLSVVAYRQPITRRQIEELVGIEVGSLLRQLVRRQLIALGDAAGEGDAYRTTSRFLELFNLQSLADLPATADLQQL